MRFPWQRKVEAPKQKSMKECLEGERPDLAVSLWLQEVVEKASLSSLPPEVVNAYLADRFLVEVNSGGFHGLFAWQSENVSRLGSALRAVGLPDMADFLDKAIRLQPGEEEEVDDRFEELDFVRNKARFLG